MSILTKALGWFVGGSKSANKVLDGITKGADKLVFTDEEKADYYAQAQKIWIDMQKAAGDEASARSITRRIIAVSVIFVFLFFLVIAGMVYPWMKDWSAHLSALIFDSDFSYIVGAVSVFYFGPTHIAPMINSIRGKNGG